MTDQSYDSTKIYIENYKVKKEVPKKKIRRKRKKNYKAYRVYSQKMSEGCVDDHQVSALLQFLPHDGRWLHDTYVPLQDFEQLG